MNLFLGLIGNEIEKIRHLVTEQVGSYDTGLGFFSFSFFRIEMFLVT